jgi:putative CocE/NonD family hydrolase
LHHPKIIMDDEKYLWEKNIKRMKKFRFLILCLLILAPLGAMGQEAQEAKAQDYVLKNYVKHAFMIPMRDGVRLYTAVYMPVDSTVHHPVIMTRTPYSCWPYAAKEFSSALWTSEKWYALNHYIIVFQDVRGRNQSEGEFLHIRPYLLNKGKKDIDEASDTYDTADWLIRHTCNNGNIGVKGISYPGFYATMAGLSGHPAIKAVSPQAPVTDWFRGDDAHHNGAFMIADIFPFLYDFDQPQPRQSKKTRKPNYKFSTDIYDEYLKMGTIANATKAIGDSDVWWSQMMAHPNLDSFWKERNPEQYMYLLGKMKHAPAVMIVGGLFDAEDQYGTFALYRSLQRQSPQVPLYLVIGPWTHGGWAFDESKHLGQVWLGDKATSDAYLKDIEFPFFDHYLNGKGQKPAHAVRIFYMGENKWHELADWTTVSSDSLSLYLNTDKSLSAKPFTMDSCLTYTSDPTHPVPYTASIERNRNTKYMAEDQRFAGLRADVLSFTSETLKDSLTVSGKIDVNLEVSLSTTDADFVVKVIDVYPDTYRYGDEVYQQLFNDTTMSTTVLEGMLPYYPMQGYEQMVRGDILRGRYRNSFEHPQAFVPNEKTVVHFCLNDVAHTFLPGHRIMIQVQSSWFPLADRNPQQFCDIYHALPSDFRKADISIWNGSKITLPIGKPDR